MGLGSLSVKYIREGSADLRHHRAHVDKCWLRKWGENDKPVNYIGAGCISGLISAIFDQNIRK